MKTPLANGKCPHCGGAISGAIKFEVMTRPTFWKLIKGKSKQKQEGTDEQL
jgi:hypothetical protein